MWDCRSFELLGLGEEANGEIPVVVCAISETNNSALSPGGVRGFDPWAQDIHYGCEESLAGAGQDGEPYEFEIELIEDDTKDLFWQIC